ncbi:MAG: pyruvate kinase [Gemmatimonadota bacterium]|nr:pyruvate kinase [Gemmatimonadota bacterium]MDH5195873.1 pyruvate kinase [Gemmatimonadota bacterium]
MPILTGRLASPPATPPIPRFHRTKIVATVGPASQDPEMLRRFFELGVNVIRVNSSHGTPEQRAQLMDRVRSVAEAEGRHIAVLVDLQGPRIRVGALRAPRDLVPESDVVFAPEAVAAADEIPTTYEALGRDVSPGARILLDDGLLSVEVRETDGVRVVGRVVHGGLLRGNKGINLPGIRVSTPVVTAKDREDIALAVAHGADYIGISFVSEPADVIEVRDLVPDHVALVAKIERATALAQAPQIIAAADAVMVARGDLGVELPYEEVPLAQKRLIRLANAAGRPVITATQMLESMIENPRPTRAEASDVANAILDGTDAVMLSAETAMGRHPVAAVDAMARIIHEIERTKYDESEPERRRRHRRDGAPVTVEDAIAAATASAADMLRVPVIVSFTKSGFTARKISALRPASPILGLSTEPGTCRQLALVWGVVPELASRVPDYGAMVDVARDTLIDKGYARSGDLIVVTAGVPFEVPGTTNLLKVEVV